MKKYLSLAVAATMAATPALADKVKVGYMTTLSGGAGIIGKQMQNAVNLAMDIQVASLVAWKLKSFLLMTSANRMWLNSLLIVL